jgi:flagellar biosynthesis protein FlhG
MESPVKEVLTDQAEGLRRLMASSPGRLVAVVGSGPAVGVTSVTLNLAAALMLEGKDALVLDEHRATPPDSSRRDGRLVLVDTLLDADGLLSPLALRADNILVVLQPSTESITASYALIKRLRHVQGLKRLRVMVNNVTNMEDAQRILANLNDTGSRYLALTLESAGLVRSDLRLVQARRLNLTVVEAFRTSPAAIDFQKIAADLLNWPWRVPGGCPPSGVAGAMTRYQFSSVLEMN